MKLLHRVIGPHSLLLGPGTKRVARVEENTAADRLELTQGRSRDLAAPRRPPASAMTKETWL